MIGGGIRNQLSADPVGEAAHTNPTLQWTMMIAPVIKNQPAEAPRPQHALLTPTVKPRAGLKCDRVNCSIRDDLPTLESPVMMYLRIVRGILVAGRSIEASGVAADWMGSARADDEATRRGRAAGGAVQMGPASKVGLTGWSLRLGSRGLSMGGCGSDKSDSWFETRRSEGGDVKKGLGRLEQ